MKRHFLAAVFLFAALPLRAQVPDARLLPAGSLRWAFTPSWKSWDRVLDSLGNERLLSSMVSSDSAGASLFPTLALANAAMRGLTGNNALSINLGAMRTTLDADVRRFPLEFAVGLGSRITMTGTFPLVVTRMNSLLTLDSTSGNAGWNQGLAQSGNSGGATAITNLLAQYGTSATQLAQRIVAGTHTCPGGAAQAQRMVTRLQDHQLGITVLTGVGGFGAPPAAAPTAGSTAGLAITSAIRADSDTLVLCGLPSIGTLPLPAGRFSSADVQTVLTTPTLGYTGSPFQYTKLTGLGDLELGLRIGAVQAPHARVVAFGGARLPTGTRDSAANFIDIAPADRQLDVTGGFEAALEPGSVVALSLAGSFTRQFPDELDARLAPPEQIISTAPIMRVKRDLGDQLVLSVFPGLRLNEAFRVYAGGTYYRKGADRYSGVPGADSIGLRSEVRSMTFGGGIQYRSVGAAKGLPVEAGLTYSAVYTASGGFVPKATTLTMYLRFYYWLWGGNGERETGNGER